MKKFLYILIFGVWFNSSYCQNEILLTQFMYHKLSLNPSYAGLVDNIEFTLTHRDQYNGFPAAPSSQLLSINLPSFEEQFGLGIDLLHTSIGIEDKIRLSISTAYKIQFPKASLSLGIKPSFTRYSFDFTDSKLVANQGITIDPQIPKEIIETNVFNIGFGLYWLAEKYYISISSPSITKPVIKLNNDITNSHTSRQVYLMAGYKFEMNHNIVFHPQIFLKYSEIAPLDMDLNFSILFDKKHSAALTYRFGGASENIGESIDIMFGFGITENILLGFSLDFTLSTLRTFDNGSFELLLRYSLKNSNNNGMVNPRYF